MSKAYDLALKLQHLGLKNFTYLSDTQKFGVGEVFDRGGNNLLKGEKFSGDCDRYSGELMDYAVKSALLPADQLFEGVTPNHYISGVICKETNEVYVTENTGFEYTKKALDHPDFAVITQMPTHLQYEEGFIVPKVYKLSDLQKGVVIPEKRGNNFMIPASVKQYRMEEFRTVDEPLGEKWWVKRTDVPFIKDFTGSSLNQKERHYTFTKEWLARLTLNVGFFKVDITFDSEKPSGEKFNLSADVGGIKVLDIKKQQNDVIFKSSRWKGIVIHMSDSSWGTEKDIDNWHKDNGWDGTGYHFVIQNGQYNNQLYLNSLDGMIEAGRNINKTGAHTKGHNKSMLGICLIHNSKPTELQCISLFNLVRELQVTYGIDNINVLGHNELANRDCPGFDVSIFREALETDDVDRFISRVC